MPPAPSTPASFRLQTLGSAGLHVEGTDAPVLGPGKPLAVLIYLALAPGRRASRESLLDLCWADLDPARGRPALRQALFHLRRLLGEGAITGSEELVLALPIPVDRDHFLDAVHRDALEEAVARYTGPFLVDFGIPGGAAFEHWADLERDRLESLFRRSAELVVRRELNRSAWRPARRVAERLRALQPEPEANWRLVLECALASGDPLAIAVEADALERHATAGERLPEPASRALLATARRAPLAEEEVAPPGQLVAGLTGRGREFAAITAAWAQARRGPARHIHIVAPAGLGKSRLLQEIAGRLRASGDRVLMVTAVAGDRDITYAFLGEMIAHLAALPGAIGVAPDSAAALVAINPALSSRFSVQPDATAGEEALRRRTHAVHDLLQAVCAEQPVALLIDDAHWIDPSSLRVIEAFCDRLGSQPCLCVTAARPECALVRAATVEIHLEPLSVAETGELISALGELPTGTAWASALGPLLHRTSRGIPLLILQSLRLALDAQLLTLDAGVWRCEDPERLGALLGEGEAIRHRIASLPAAPSRILVALAVVGTPVSVREVSHDCGLAGDHVQPELDLLERMGLVRRTSEGWATVHDEVAAVACDLASADWLRDLRHRIGVRLVTSRSDDPQRALRGCRHLFEAGDRAVLGASFRQLVRGARARGDRRPLDDLAGDVTGAGGSRARDAELVAAIPWHWRLGLWSSGRLAAGIALLAAGLFGTTAAVAWRSARAHNLPTLWYLEADQGASRIAVDPAILTDQGGILETRADRSVLEAAARAFPEYPPMHSPDGLRTVWNVHVGGAATIDIWISTPDGERNLTARARDQYATDWTPDGRFIVGASNEWSPPDQGAYDIAVFDPVTGAARQVTTGPEHDRHALASPDGSRIAFIRESGDRPYEVCVVPFDGRGEAECRLPRNAAASLLVGWTTPTELVVVLLDAGTSNLVRYDWGTGVVTPVIGPFVEAALLSPDRRWVATRARIAGVPGVREWLVPLDRPSDLREVRLRAPAATPTRWWEGRPDTRAMVDTLTFADSTRTLLLGVSRKLMVRAVRADGGDAPIYAPLRWRSSDTTIATVDAQGVVHPVSGGEVTIVASLAGWRTTSARFRIEGATDRLVLEETWDTSWVTRWITFGDPLPTTAIGPGGIRGFWNRGDGVFESFGVLRRSLDPSAGLGVEVLLSTPLTRPTWLRSRIGLMPSADTARLLRAPMTGAPAGIASGRDACAIGYPATDGGFGRAHLSVAGGVHALVPLRSQEERLASGAWWRLRLQLLPDGRCGVAVDGTPLWLSPEPADIALEYWLRLGESSADARLLHGPLTVWEGVRTDIDWTSVARDRGQ